MKGELYFLAFAVAACSGNSVPPTKSSSIGAEGGTVQISDGTSVSVPAGALAQPTQISVGGEPNNISIPDVVLVGPAYRFGPEGTQFSVPVTVTLHFDASKLPSGDTTTDIEIMTAPVGSPDFVAVATTLVDDSHVSATTTHFSDFVAAAHRKNHQDQGVVMMDQGASVMDQGSSSTMDMSIEASDGSVDAGNNGDMVTRDPCLPSSGGQCIESINNTVCGGAYSLNCIQSICICNHNNSNTQCTKPIVMNGGCPSQAQMDNVWLNCCHFP
jgi:hypothetical protein